MVKTLLLYDGKMSSAERIAKKLCYIIGNARVAEITEAPEDLSPYGGFCFVFNFYGSLTTGKTKNFLVANRELLSEKRIALVGIGFSDLGYAKYIVDMQEVVGDSGETIGEPKVFFHTVGDSSINFDVILHAKQLSNKNMLKHVFIKDLTKRYREENITIPYPIRTILQDK